METASAQQTVTVLIPVQQFARKADAGGKPKDIL